MSSPPDPFPFHTDPWWYKAFVLTFVFVPLAVTAFAIWRLWGTGVSWLEVGLLVGAWTVTGMGISVGYHRMLTHRAFEAKAPVRALTLIFGSMAMQGGAADWAATHTRHHARADQEGDPHSPLEGFWHAHTAWLFRDRFVRSGTVYAKLMEDPVTNFVTRTFHIWAIIGMLLPAAIAGLITMSWAGAFSGLLWGGFVRVFLGHHITWSVNSVAHQFGTRPFVTKDESRNNVIVALLGFGEGWHNNHHAFPRAAFLGIKWWQFDPGRWAIKTMEKLGLVWNVWMPTPEEMERRRAHAH